MKTNQKRGTKEISLFLNYLDDYFENGVFTLWKTINVWPHQMYNNMPLDFKILCIASPWRKYIVVFLLRRISIPRTNVWCILYSSPLFSSLENTLISNLKVWFSICWFLSKTHSFIFFIYFMFRCWSCLCEFSLV